MHVVNSLNLSHSLVVIRCLSYYYHQRCAYTGALLLPTKKGIICHPQNTTFWVGSSVIWFNFYYVTLQKKARPL
jgi:hypothetical protein